MSSILLVGNPNCGKTTLFNALTGGCERVGNWPGVTVEKKEGAITFTNQQMQLIDIPGIYSATSSREASIDEQIAVKALLEEKAELIINVIDACHLERHLYLTSQLLELKKPLIVVLNMMDLAEAQGIHIDIQALSNALHCPVIPIQAHKKIGVEALKDTIDHSSKITIPVPFTFSKTIHSSLLAVEKEMLLRYDANEALYISRRLMEGDTLIDVQATQLITEDLDILIADARYGAIHQLVSLVQKKTKDKQDQFTAKLDNLVLHRFLGVPIFLVVIYTMFLFAINIGGAFQDFFDITSDAIFVQGSAWLLIKLHMPAWVIALFSNGIGKGINTTLTFVPVITAMFFFLSLLEVSGYMARAAFVVDRLMRQLGLPGKSFVPMIVGFGCNVPAIMSARTLDSERDRLLTILMSPFMSCSARLAIYAVFVAAFFPNHGQNIVFSLYMIGILMAVFTGLLLRKTLFKDQTASLVLELPAYHSPSWRRLFKETFFRLNYFIFRAGKFILPLCVILGGLNAIMLHGGINPATAHTDSVLAWIGQLLTPLFAPMGIHTDNWPATVGLLAGMLAKEVVIGSLNTLYSQLGHLELAAESFNLWASLKTALWSIPQNLFELSHAVINPILSSSNTESLSPPVNSMLSRYFDGQIGAYAYLLFILLYIPCVSTMAAIRQEANRKLMWLSIGWSLMIAYSVAVLFYQLATSKLHPFTSLLWLGMMVMIYGVLYYGLRLSAQQFGVSNVASSS